MTYGYEQIARLIVSYFDHIYEEIFEVGAMPELTLTSFHLLI